MRGLLLGLIVVGALVVSTGASADPAPGLGAPPPAYIPSPQADWSLLATSRVPPHQNWTGNRIYYARTPEQAQRWGRAGYLASSDRQVLSHLNFSRYGVLAIFSDNPAGFRTDAVYSSPGSLAASIQLKKWCFGSASCPSPAPSLAYSLLKIRKGSLPAPVKKLYIYESWAMPVEPPPPPPPPVPDWQSCDDTIVIAVPACVTVQPRRALPARHPSRADARKMKRSRFCFPAAPAISVQLPDGSWTHGDPSFICK